VCVCVCVVCAVVCFFALHVSVSQKRLSVVFTVHSVLLLLLCAGFFPTLAMDRLSSSLPAMVFFGPQTAPSSTISCTNGLALWNLTTTELVASNAAFLQLLEPYTSAQLRPPLRWPDYLATCGMNIPGGADCPAAQRVRESLHRMAVVHGLLRAGRLQSCAMRLHLANSIGAVFYCHLMTSVLYDEHNAPSEVMWTLKPLAEPAPTVAGCPAAYSSAADIVQSSASSSGAPAPPPETNINDALSAQIYEQAETKLVEIKRRKIPVQRKPWDSNTAKFALKRPKRDSLSGDAADAAAAAAGASDRRRASCDAAASVMHSTTHAAHNDFDPPLASTPAPVPATAAASPGQGWIAEEVATPAAVLSAAPPHADVFYEPPSLDS